MSTLKPIIRHRNSTTCLLTYANQNRNQDCFNDVIIKTDNNQKIPANRMVLSCYSTFFEKMFKSKMKEQYQHSVYVKGIEEKSLKPLIDYIYSGQITINSDNVMSLLAGADYLQLDEVKDFCFDFMEEKLTSDNYFTFLNLANLYNSDSVKNKVYNFICSNYETLTETEDFKNLSNVNLTTSISMLNQYPVKQIVICKSILEWTKHDKEERSSKLADLLNQVNFDKLPIEYLQNVVFDDLIQQNLTCLQIMNCHLFKLLKTSKLSEVETKVLSIGGRKTGKKVFEVYSGSSRESVDYPDLPEPLRLHCSLKVNSSIYCIGGFSHDANIADVRILELNDYLRWEQAMPMNEARSLFGAAVFLNNLIVAGGHGENNDILDSTESYEIATKKWKTIAPLQRKRKENHLVVCDGHLFALGGNDGNTYLSSVERFDDTKNEWNEVASMRTPRSRFAAVSYEGFIYAIGGKTRINKVVKTVEKYDPRSNTWTYVSSMESARYDHRACVLGGKIIVIGGWYVDDSHKKIELYLPLCDQWLVETTVKEIVDEHSLVVV